MPQIVGFSIVFIYHAVHSSACAGNQSGKQVRQKMQQQYFFIKRIQGRLRQRDLSQIVKPTAINLLRSAARFCEIWQNTSFPISNFGCDTKMFLARQRGFFDFANKQVLRGLTPNGGVTLCD
jgi:hypothetical protein